MDVTQSPDGRQRRKSLLDALAPEHPARLSSSFFIDIGWPSARAIRRASRPATPVSNHVAHELAERLENRGKVPKFLKLLCALNAVALRFTSVFLSGFWFLVEPFWQNRRRKTTFSLSGARPSETHPCFQGLRYNCPRFWGKSSTSRRRPPAVEDGCGIQQIIIRAPREITNAMIAAHLGDERNDQRAQTRLTLKMTRSHPRCSRTRQTLWAVYSGNRHSKHDLPMHNPGENKHLKRGRRKSRLAQTQDQDRHAVAKTMRSAAALDGSSVFVVIITCPNLYYVGILSAF